jgi:hypothetical protein
MPIKNRVLTGNAVERLSEHPFISVTLKDPSKRLDFSPENAIFAHHPPQADRYLRWLDASSQQALVSRWFAVNPFPIELCRYITCIQ